MNYASQPIKTKEMYQRDLTMSRMNLLLSVIFTVVNLVMVMISISTSFLFSASIPHYLSLFFAVNCGLFDDSYYQSFYGDDWKNELVFFDPSIFWAVFAFSVAIIIGLFLLWFFSKKHKVCSMITLSFYIVDTLFLVAFSFFVGAGGIDLILQLLFHAWIVYYAVLSVRAWKGIGTAPTAAEVAAKSGYSQTSYGANPYMGSPYGRPYGGYDDDEEDEENEEDEAEADDVSEEELVESEDDTDETESE
ncbi:MAG: hypothetical protein IJD35_08360 [Clostridia bacterium]|nr:hypothetical protein [Clostridia bacterium]